MNPQLNAYLNFLDEKNLSLTTIQLYKSLLKRVNLNDVNALKNIITNPRLKANTQQTYRVCLMEYFKFHNDNKTVKALKLIKIKQQGIIYRPILTKAEVYALTQIKLNDDKKQIKVKTIIKFLFETGIRISELWTLSYENNKLFVNGKGNKRRQIFYVSPTLTALLALYPDLVINRRAKTVRNWIKSLLGPEFSPHSLRRSFASYLLLSGANVKSVMLQMGHSNVQTTYGYLNLSEEYNKSTYQKFFN